MPGELNVSYNEYIGMNGSGKTNVEMITIYTVLNYFNLVTDIIKLMLCLCVIVVDIYLISIICRAQETHTKTNNYVKHFTIFHLTYMMGTSVLWTFIDTFALFRYLGTSVLCMVMQVETSSIEFCHLFSFGLVLEWIFASYPGVRGGRLGWIQKYSFHIFYATGFVTFVIQNVMCFTIYWRVRQIIRQAVYITTLISIGICNYFEYTNKVSRDPDRSYSITIANIMILSWGPLYLYQKLIDLTTKTVIPRIVILLTMFIPEWLAYCCTIIIVVMLKNVDMSLKVVCTSSSKKSQQKYDMDDCQINYADQKCVVDYNDTTYI